MIKTFAVAEIYTFLFFIPLDLLLCPICQAFQNSQTYSPTSIVTWAKHGWPSNQYHFWSSNFFHSPIVCYNRIQSSLGKKSLTQRIKIKAFYRNLLNSPYTSNSQDFGPMCFAVSSGFGCPLRLIMTLRKLSTSHFQRRTPSIFFRTEKKNISSLPPLLIATLIATKAFLLEPPTLFSFYRFFLTIGNISSPSFFLESWWQLFFYWIGDFFAAYRKSFFGTQISYMPINVMHIKRLGSDQRHKNSQIHY